MLRKVSGRTNIDEGSDAVVEDMAASIQEVISECGRDDLAGIGVGVPGFIEMKTGVVLESPNLPFFVNFPMRDALAEKLGAPVALENDANAAAMGEKWMGAGREVKDLVLLTLGTGVGGGIIVDGKVLHGFVGMAAELGHMTVIPTGNPCGCGNQGCLEKHASATAIITMAQLVGLGDGLTSEQVYDMAIAGNEKARHCFEVMGRALGIGLATLINTFNFPLYLLGGGVLPAWDLFAPPMIEECRWRSFIFRNTKTRIEKATLGNDAGLFGAAFLGFGD